MTDALSVLLFYFIGISGAAVLAFHVGLDIGIKRGVRRQLVAFSIGSVIQSLCRELCCDETCLVKLIRVARSNAGQDSVDPMADLAWASQHVGLLKAVKEKLT